MRKPLFQLNKPSSLVSLTPKTLQIGTLISGTRDYLPEPLRVANRNSPLSGDIVWSSANSSLPSVRKPVGQLLDTGNPENAIWQSFDFPTDTFVAGMKLGKDLVTGVERYLTSWKSENDPSLGDYSLWIDTKGYPQMIIRDVYGIRIPWNRLRFSESRREWSLYLTLQTDACNRYGICGSFASCNISNVGACGCLEGFEPTLLGQWNVTLGSQGCRRTGSGCLLWFGDLIDIRTFRENGQDLYIRMPASELGDTAIAAKGHETIPFYGVLDCWHCVDRYK
ncbi:hypothetical protein L6452_28686 [Arctium lappa]|uniref:Uncharacterized protein n=2 Tax=Arctium lappa TaxID=4217 RepID=A0ACB8ZZZ3_ARCLA|nr:hypothetical protein L6452_28684 [Arctium lappa]KAI3702932.1 hypothetical protein L6452_28686 [Arctium lappa]